MTAIVCVDKNWAIGRENRLLFRISADLKHFRALTTGKPVVMGKNTLLSLPGGRPLPNRWNLVVSTTMAPREGVESARSSEEAAALAGEDAVLMGGAQLYRMDGELLPGLLGQRKAVRQAGVVRAQTQQPRHQCAVGAVPLAGGGKAAVQANVCLRRYLAQKLLCSIADLCRTGGVAGGGADHHRAQNIK